MDDIVCLTDIILQADLSGQVLLFIVFVVMSTNWLFALLVIVRGKDMSPRSEKMVRVASSVDFLIQLFADSGLCSCANLVVHHHLILFWS